MPRIRTLKPEHKQHRKVGMLTDREYRLWIGMITEADDEGRLVADAAWLKGVIFTYQPRVTAKQIADALATLESVGLIDLYTFGDTKYAQFPSWKDHQRVDHPSASKLPPPPAGEYRKSAIPLSVRREIAIRHGAKVGNPAVVKCHYCSAEGLAVLYSETGWANFVDLELDHVVAEVNGGAATAANIVLACRRCNRSKGYGDSPKYREDSRDLASVPGGSEGIGSDQGSDRSKDLSSPPRTLTADGLIDLYNELAPDNVPAVATRSPERLRKARQYLAKFPQETFWRAVFAQYRKSDFLCGRTAKRPGHETFTPDFDWLLSKGKDGTENAVKVHDGRYRQ